MKSTCQPKNKWHFKSLYSEKWERCQYEGGQRRRVTPFKSIPKNYRSYNLNFYQNIAVAILPSVVVMVACLFHDTHTHPHHVYTKRFIAEKYKRHATRTCSNSTEQIKVIKNMHNTRCQLLRLHILIYTVFVQESWTACTLQCAHFTGAWWRVKKKRKKRWQRKCKTETSSQKQFAELIFDWIYYFPVQFTQAPPSIIQIITVINGNVLVNGSLPAPFPTWTYNITLLNMTLFPFIICWCWCWF